jgi:hypothetical protein
MKTLHLRRDVYACQTDDGAVFMDLRTGQYFGLDLEATTAIAPHIADWANKIGSASRGDEAASAGRCAGVIDFLVNDADLLTDTLELGRASEPFPLRQTGAMPFRGNIVPRPRIRGLHVVAFCSAYLRATIDIKCRIFAAAVRRVQARKSGHARPVAIQPGTPELVRVFRWLRPFFYTTRENCLFDSLVLIEFLARFEVFPNWVIAVRTRPFAAHSWVVDDGLLLNERLEAAEEFFPILVI